jgi:YVTN family beta-propeller protein
MQFLILGPLEVRNGEETVRLGAAKQRALLGVLLLHANETVSTARLVDELWGERPPATAEKLVQGYVHALRRQLGDGVVDTQAPGYRLRVDPRSLDLLEFERLTEEARVAPVADSIELRRRALALWRGTPLADVVLEGPERHNVGRLGELRLTTQIERIDAELEIGRHAQLVGELEALVAEHPYRERAAALLMLALYRSGRQAEALEAYRTVRGRLSDELGLQPGQELRDLEAAILRQDDALAAPTVVREPPVAETAPAEPEPPAAPIRRRRRRLALGGVLALLAAAGVAGAALLLRNEPAAVVAPPNSAAVIDVDTNQVERTIPVGLRPGPVAAGAGFVWVGNLDDKSLTRIDPATNEHLPIRLEATPDAVTVGGGAVWVVNGPLSTLYRVDPGSEIVSEPIRLGQRSSRYLGAGVDVGEGSVWAAFGDATLARWDPATDDLYSARSTATGPTALVVAYDYVWVAAAAAEVQQFSPETFDVDPLDYWTVARAPSGIAAGAGAIWVACRGDDVVERIPADLNFGSPRQIPVGDGPTAVASGAGAVWVANTSDSTVSRIDPQTYDVETIEVGNAPSGIAVSGGRVWVSVQAPFTP